MKENQTMKRENFDPYPGRIYENNGGGQFICISGGDDPNSWIMKNVSSGWTFEAHGIGMYEDGTIDWNYSTGGYFDKMRKWESQSEVLNEAVKTFGKEKQVDMMIEEMSELTKALLDERRGRGMKINISEEIADVQIMIEQMKIIFENADVVDGFRDEKIARLAIRISALKTGGEE